MTNVFVDGQEGTTGLQIHQRLATRTDIEVLSIDPDKRKDATERARLLNASDIAFLCLPDDAAREAVALVTGDTRIIDASTAHRTHPDWAYGIPELSPAHRARIQTARRVSVPGCHASGFAVLVYPLIQAGILSPDMLLSVQSVTGYTGGGKKMIAEFEDTQRDAAFDSARFYALGLTHKHIPEMQYHAHLTHTPLFLPILGDFAQGMTVALPLFAAQLLKTHTPASLTAFYAAYYAGEPFVPVLPQDNQRDGSRLNPQACNGTNRVEVMVFGNDDQLMPVARLDNLGKGASGAAVQCMNAMLGLDEKTGLE